MLSVVTLIINITDNNKKVSILTIFSLFTSTLNKKGVDRIKNLGKQLLALPETLENQSQEYISQL